ncbi:hypothetical protein, partial [Burkholderia sp. Cy-647]|uniref:hypothetical protein n=2 Tax=unclassified Burkholderia TaxID=2613784 RepID=UPI0019628134
WVVAPAVPGVAAACAVAPFVPAAARACDGAGGSVRVCACAPDIMAMPSVVPSSPLNKPDGRPRLPRYDNMLILTRK